MPAAEVRFDGRLIRAVIYDYGEVLSYPPPADALAAISNLLRITPGQLREFYYAERHDYDRGELTPEEYWQAVARDAGAQLDSNDIEWLRRTDVTMWSHVNPTMLTWASQLRSQGVRTAVLSNMHADMAKSVRAEFAWLRDYECVILSAEVRSAKPEPQIFNQCLNCLKVSADEALFIDDKPRNTTAAEHLGMATICADSPASIRSKLQEAGWNAPLPE